MQARLAIILCILLIIIISYFLVILVTNKKILKEPYSFFNFAIDGCNASIVLSKILIIEQKLKADERT